jgi:hypothetical protein
LELSNEEEIAIEAKESGVREFIKLESQNVKDLYALMTEADPNVKYFSFFYGLGIGK